MTVDGSVVSDGGWVVQEGMRVVYHRDPWEEPEADVADLMTLHDDGALVVVRKPSGLPVLPSELYFENTVLTALQRSRPVGAEAPHPVHRLGVGTSGLLICAVGASARSAISRAFEGRRVSKMYRALASGVIPSPVDKPVTDPITDPATGGGADSGSGSGSGSGVVCEARRRKRERHEQAVVDGAVEEATCGAGSPDGVEHHTAALSRSSELPDEATFEISCPIGPVPHCSWAGSVHGAMPEGGEGSKPALSIVRVLRRDVEHNCTLVEVSIPTGRPHQIRIHMAYLGHPLVGDPLYVKGGGPAPAPAPAAPSEATLSVSSSSAAAQITQSCERPPLPRDGGYLLHAFRATLPHPVSGKLVSFCARPPRELCLPSEEPHGHTASEPLK